MQALSSSRTRLLSLILSIGFCKTLLAGPGQQPITVNHYSTQDFIVSSSAVNTDITVTDHSIVEFLQNSTISSADISIDGTSTLIFDQGINDTVTGAITGTGTILRQGTTELNITSNNAAFAGNTFVQGGVLNINSVLGGNVTVEPLGEITVSGTVGGNLTVTGGTVIPGAVLVGQLNVGGDYSSDAFSTYDVNINGANATLISIAGNSQVHGTVNLQSAVNPTLTKYPIMFASGGVIVQNYSTLIESSSLRFMIGYDPTHVYLLYLGPCILAGNTPNQKHVANAINDIPLIPTPCELSLLANLCSLSQPQLLDALDSFSGAQYAYITDIVQYADRNFSRTIFEIIREQLQDCPYWKGDDIQVWIDGGYGQNRAHGNYNARGYKAHNYALSMGAYTCALKKFLVGLAGEYERDHVNFRQGGNNIFHTGQGALYASYPFWKAYLFSDLIIGKTVSGFKRPIRYGTNRAKTFSNVRAVHGLFYIEAGVNVIPCYSVKTAPEENIERRSHGVLQHFNVIAAPEENIEERSRAVLQPFVAFEWDRNHGRKIKEHGAQCLNLTIGSKNVTTGNLYVGAHFSGYLRPYLSLNADAAWKHRIDSQGTTNRTRFDDFANSFKIYGARQGRNGLIGIFEILGVLSDNFELNLAVSGEKWKRWSAYQVSAGLNAKW
jgi:uncharacterized protein with beta-barrel porin domain